MLLFEVLRKCHLGTLSEIHISQAPSKCLSKWIEVDRWDCLKNPSHELKKICLFRVPMNPQKDQKVKLQRTYFFNVRSDRIASFSSFFLDKCANYPVLNNNNFIFHFLSRKFNKHFVSATESIQSYFKKLSTIKLSLKNKKYYEYLKMYFKYYSSAISTLKTLSITNLS